MEEKDNNQSKILDKKETNLFSTSKIFDNNINKVWIHLRDLALGIKIVPHGDNLKYIKGKNTWTVGNIFSYDWVGLTHLIIKCTFIKEEINRKIIRWKKNGDIGINYYKTYYFYKITKTDKTLVKIVVSKTEKINKLIDVTPISENYFRNLVFKELSLRDKYLNNMKEDIISCQSCVINAHYMEVWKFITNLKKLAEIVPSLGSNIEYKGSNLEQGTFIKYSYGSSKIICFMKIIEIKTPKKKKTFIYKLQTIGSDIVSLPKNIVFKVAIISNSKSYLSVLHLFPKNTDKEFIKNFDINKKETFIKIKQYLEKK